MKVDIVITVHNRFDYLERCLDSIFAADTTNLNKVIVSDDKSTDKGLQNLLERYDNIIYTQPKKRCYGSANGNHGSKFVTTDYFILLNSDTKVYSEDWINKLLEATGPDVGIVSPCFSAYFDPSFVKRDREHERLGSMCWLLNTSLWRDLGGYRTDGKYVHWHSDFEFCDRVRALGLKIRQVPTFIAHRGGRSKKYLPKEIWETR